MKFGIEHTPQRAGRRTLCYILGNVLGLSGSACFLAGVVQAGPGHGAGDRALVLPAAGLIVIVLGFVVRFSMPPKVSLRRSRGCLHAPDAVDRRRRNGIP